MHCAPKPAQTQSSKTLAASLTADLARMNNKLKHKQVTRQMKHQTAESKAKASAFLFFTAHFFRLC